MSQEQRTPQNALPYLCAKCGEKHSLSLQDHAFRFRPIVGWVALPFGMAIEYVWVAPIYFCKQCAKRMRRARQISILPVILGIILACVTVFSAFLYLDYGWTLLLLALISVIIGIVLYAVIYTSVDPKARVTRDRLVLEIPGYGEFDYTRSPNAQRTK